MPVEPFVMRDVARAREWVEVFSKSCGVTADYSASVLASLCGFGSWDVMTFAINSMPPSSCDEAISDEEVQERRCRYIATMTGTHSIQPLIALAVADFLSPSAGTPLQGFDALELMEEMGGDDDDDEFDVDSLFGSFTSPIAHEIVIPLACELDSAWENVFEYIGWCVEPLFNEYEIVGTPSFVIPDPIDDSRVFPVYQTLALPEPAFSGMVSDYPTIRLVQSACLGVFYTDWAAKSPGFLLLSAQPQIARHNGRHFCYVGQMYIKATGRWVDLLLNKACEDIWRLRDLNANVKEGFQGASKLGDRNDNFAKRVALLLSGFDPENDDVDDWTVVAAETGHGWYLIKAVLDEHYDFRDLEPHMMTPLLRF